MSHSLNKLIALLAAALVLLSMACVLPPAFAEGTTRLATVNYSGGLNLRTGAGTGYQSIEIMPNGTVLTILGEQKASNGELWYHVSKYDSPSETGYVHSGYVLVVDIPVADPAEDAEFEAYLDEQGFPESYRGSLRLLHSMYPEWVFVAVDTGLEWSTVLANEAIVGRNLVPRSSNKLWINTSDVDANGNQIGRDGANWVAASPEIVAYYLDPRNFLNLSYIFQFESLSYVAGVQTIAGTENILAPTFMSSSNTVTYNETEYTFAEIFQAAAEASGASPYHLASRARQEQGVSGTTLSSGSVAGYEGYYNFFNINAYTTSAASAVVNGAIHAKTQGWSSPYTAIVEGSHFIARAYISKGQDTLYFQKFNVVNRTDGLFIHQYMTNVVAAASEASTLRNAYSDYNLPIVFNIPVYSNMPETAVQRPSESTVPSVTLADLSISTYVTGATLKTDVAELLSNAVITNGGSIKITGASGGEKTSGTLATGDTLSIYYSSGNLYRSYKFVVLGDSNADGQLTIQDLLAIQKHLLDISHLSKERMSAADINADGKIDIRDLLAVQKHLLGISLIG